MRARIGHLASPNRPDRFVGHGHAVHVGFTNAGQSLFELDGTDGASQVLFVLGFAFTNAQHHGHTRFDQLEALSVDVFIRFTKNNATLRVPRQCPLDADGLEHLSRDGTRKSTGHLGTDALWLVCWLVG